MPFFDYSTVSLNKSQDQIWTSAYYIDRGDGTTDWVHVQKTYDGGDVVLGKKADAAATVFDTTPGTAMSMFKTIAAKATAIAASAVSLVTAIGASGDTVTPTGNGASIPLLKAIRDNTRWRRPSDSTQVNVTSGNVANTAAVAAMPATASVTNYVTGIEITFAGATAAANFVATLAGLLTGTISFICTAPAGATVAGVPILLNFDPPIPASAVNTAITLTLPALGAGNTHACVNIHGYRV